MGLFSSNSNHGPPMLIFHPPDAHGKITASTPQNQELAQFSLSKSTLTRLMPTQQQICTFSRSSWSGTPTMTFLDHQIKFREVVSIHARVQELDTRFGKLRWKSRSSGYEELYDTRDVLLARGKALRTMHFGPGDLEVFIAGDGALLDLILAAWLEKCGAGTAEGDAEAVEAIADVVGAVAGT